MIEVIISDKPLKKRPKEISGIYDNIGVAMEFVINPDWGYTMVRIDRSSLDRVVKEQIEFCLENM